MKQTLIKFRKAVERSADITEYYRSHLWAMTHANKKAFPDRFSPEHVEYQRLLKRNPELAKLQRLLFIDILIESL